MGPPTKPLIRLPFVRNWISLAGVIVALGSIFAFVLLLIFDLFAAKKNPYQGIFTWLVAPGFLLVGLFLMFLGRLLYRHQEARTAGKEFKPTLVIDLTSERHRRYLAVFFVGGVAFLLVSAIGSYESYHATNSVQFCGAACHTPMQPQFVAYQNSPHAQVECTQCHIGTGAANFLKAKFNGVHQLFATFRNDFERPIESHGTIPITQKTCEQCHWPEWYAGNIDRTYPHFLADETNTQFNVRLLLKVGGGDPTHGPVGGIHWHMNLANKVEYIATDEKKQEIPWVRFSDGTGKVTEYRTRQFTDDPSQHTIYTMDCMDCHNRPAHHFRSPNDSIDLAMSAGKIDSSVPWIKSNIVAAFTRPYSTQAEALEKIGTTLRQQYPTNSKLNPIIAEVQRIYSRTIFPEMKADWRVHPDNIGHKNWPGCFRCHDGLHKAPDGKRMISANDCNSCHTIVAQGDPGQMEQLSAKGHRFMHVDAEYSDFSCANCHTGAFIKE